jgi:hypothetical protein
MFARGDVDERITGGDAGERVPLAVEQQKRF